ncbi:2,3-bisphosphoglycerate-dependent phosphoglycerate mutase [Lactobacillus sp. S2-2]|uniref:2,3-bisphosphoglycerate-dependent phosphoglycerate mutase n=1 Tax=Lactobacillus sp. S2-2 TaxID=2692917 RepID=UPI001F19EDBF|nr:2,3-diphosphoglycerate-dependent phosphoglycerate mutase [Lactobacillus sp. S2-2]MCF6515634.1 2,3-bisphosphoglycerate-dependent phosphoglycerate mutase [Lactobacillus sp. S2-2]
MSKLIIMRHGESEANQKNIFTGWSDVPLTEKGVFEAQKAGNLLNQLDLNIKMVHTSFLKRAILTSNIILSQINQSYLPINKSWRLNERHYGALRGLEKNSVKKEYGEKQYKLWRRSFKEVPPELSDSVISDSKYLNLGVTEPKAESLEMTYNRVVPYYNNNVVPKLLDGENQLIIAHGSSLRALIKYLENISDDEIDKVEVPNGEPIIYTFDDQLNILNKEVIEKENK